MSHHANDFRTREKLLEQKITQQATQIATLKAALRSFLDNNVEDSLNDEGQDVAMAGAELNDHNDTHSEELDTDEENEHDDLQKPFWDSFDDVYRCLEYDYEVVEGLCQYCLAKYDWDLENDEHPGSSISIDNEALKSERCLAPRGITPLRDVHPSGIPAIYPDAWPKRAEQFHSLLECGATRLMCETFHLSYTHETGIVAWADGDIYEAFSGTAMQKGDFWKIHLGRQIELDEDDFDGSQFLEGLLEDVLLFPMVPYVGDRAEGRWETVEESPGIWVTRPKADMDAAESDENSGNSSECNIEDYETLYQREDEALEGLGDAPDNPVLYSDRYESSPEAESDIEMTDGDSSEHDAGYAWQANVSDRVYDPSNESDNDTGEGETQDDEGEDGAGTLGDDSDSAGSDFDSDEVLSGDEGALLAGMKSLNWS